MRWLSVFCFHIKTEDDQCFQGKDVISARLQGQYYCNILCNNILIRSIAPYCRTEYCNILKYWNIVSALVHSVHIYIIWMYVHIHHIDGHTVLFVENQPVGSRSVSSQSTVGRSVGRSVSHTVSRSVASLRHNYAVLKFNVERKRWCTRRGSASFAHHCPLLAKWARLVIERHEILPVNMEGQPWEKTAGHALDQSPFGQSVGRSVSQSVGQSVSQLVNARKLAGFLRKVLYVYTYKQYKRLGLCIISIISFIAIFSLLSRYDVFLFVITIIATEIVKGYR